MKKIVVDYTDVSRIRQGLIEEARYYLSLGRAVPAAHCFAAAEDLSDKSCQRLVNILRAA